MNVPVWPYADGVGVAGMTKQDVRLLLRLPADLAHRHKEWRAFVAYQDALMEKEEGLTKAEREMIVVAISGANAWLYCVVAHGAILRVRTKQPTLADQLAVDYRKADLQPRHPAMLAYAVKLAVGPAEVDE